MTSVNPVVPPDQHHPAAFMDQLFREIREAYAGEDMGGLRPSHLRVIGWVPPEGISITELGERVGMSKQGCGQFVSALVESGDLVVEQDPSDRRVRLVRRTPLGDRHSAAFVAISERLEEDWARRVGERRYRTFRRVLEELALRAR
jgi:DNA-binding MarR family transcriptional regulator